MDPTLQMHDTILSYLPQALSRALLLSLALSLSLAMHETIFSYLSQETSLYKTLRLDA